MTAPRSQHVVQPAQALKLFAVGPDASLRQLNAAYHSLVLKYHPDRNPSRQQWAHTAMTRINAAYDVAVEYLGQLRFEEVEAQLEGEIRAHDEFTVIFGNIANRVLDGVFTFYQYGLDNPHRRRSGTPRLRYRQAARRVHDAITQLRQLRVPNTVDGETLQVFTCFSVAFYECMRMSRTATPALSQEAKAYRHYAEGTRALDQAIKRAFFREELSSRDGASPQNLAVSLSEFMTVVTRYSGSSWVTETAVRLCLLDAFQALLAISERLAELGLES